MNSQGISPTASLPPVSPAPPLALSSAPTFQATLEKHLLAIQNRDLVALADTVSLEQIVLITAEGRLVTSSQEFLAMHRDWFEGGDWTMDIVPVRVFEGPDVGVAILRLDYREEKADEEPRRQESFLTLTFEKHDDRWEMVHDQNTPVRRKAPSPDAQ
ncbi:MAG: SgcJ/EcaC family oxidoreductase [Polyangiaceae bacterium]